MIGTVTGYLLGASEQPGEIYKVGLVSVRMLMAVGDLLIGWRLLEQARVAHTALEADPGRADAAFYEGKIATAAFFTANMLPPLTALRTIVDAVDTELMDLPEAAF